METEVLNKPIRKSFPVTGMSCASCAVSIESSLKSASGVIDAGVNFANESAWAAIDEEVTSLIDLQKVIQSIGLDRSAEHTSELQSLMRISYAVLCLNKIK